MIKRFSIHPIYSLVGHIVSEDHKLPKGGLFDTVTSAHFLTEILIHGAIGLTLGFKHQTWWLCTGYVPELFQSFKIS